MQDQHATETCGTEMRAHLHVSWRARSRRQLPKATLQPASPRDPTVTEISGTDTCAHLNGSWGARSRRQLPKATLQLALPRDPEVSAVPKAPLTIGAPTFDALLHELAQVHIRELQRVRKECGQLQNPHTHVTSAERIDERQMSSKPSALHAIVEESGTQPPRHDENEMICGCRESARAESPQEVSKANLVKLKAGVKDTSALHVGWKSGSHLTVEGIDELRTSTKDSTVHGITEESCTQSPRHDENEMTCDGRESARAESPGEVSKTNFATLEADVKDTSASHAAWRSGSGLTTDGIGVVHTSTKASALHGIVEESCTQSPRHDEHEMICGGQESFMAGSPSDVSKATTRVRIEADSREPSLMHSIWGKSGSGLTRFLPSALNPVQKAILTEYAEKTQAPKTSNSKKGVESESLNEFAMAKGWLPNDTAVKSKSSLSSFLISELVRSSTFDTVCAAAIILNGVVYGLSVNQSAKLDDPDKLPLAYVIADRIFTGFFICELFLRIVGLGPRVWLCSSRWRWHILDAVVVAIDVLETVIQVVLQTSSTTLLHPSALRSLRMLRIARAIRMVRLLRFFKDLRYILISLIKSGASLLWCVLMMSIVIYIFAVFLMQNVVYHLHQKRDDPVTEDYGNLKHRFGSLSASCYTLFQCVTDGISWHEISEPLFAVNWTSGAVFCFYVFFTMIALMNIITGIFVQTALTSAQNDAEETIKEQMHSEDSAVMQLKRLFNVVATEQAGYFTCKDLEKNLQEPGIRAQFRLLGIDVIEAKGFFRLLDLDGSGRLSIEEFIYGCMRLKGGAKNVDLTTLLYEHKRMAIKWAKFFAMAKAEFERHEQFEQNIEQMIAGSIEKSLVPRLSVS